jgi:hypothetical protein
MAVHILFKGTERSETNNHELELFENGEGEIFISVYIPDIMQESYICLDKQSAIRLSKHLKNQISQITNS